MDLSKREKIALAILIVIVGSISIFKVLRPKTEEPLTVETEEDVEDLDLETKIEEEQTSIVVHIAGQVKEPGILELDSSSRIVDAVELAGGLEAEADLRNINLARKLKDEEKIYIPKVGEVEPVDKGEISQEGKGAKTDLIDLNTSSKEELMSLPGVGEKTAEKILEHRKENLFKSIEDIKNVSGIGDKKYEAIKDMITVN